MTKRLLGFGHSHVNAIRMAADRLLDGNIDWQITIIDAGAHYYSPWIDFPDGHCRFNPDLMRDIVDGVVDLEPALVFSALDGADYIPYAIVKNPRPFDVIIPSEPELPLIACAEIIPFDLICSIFRPNLRLAFSMLRLISDATGATIFHLCPPPPIGDEAHIKAYPGQLLSERLAEYGAAPALLRYKLWRLFTGVLRGVCEEHGASFVDIPSGSCDADGFLLPEYFHSDPVHGNAAYGELVVRQMIDLASATSEK